MSNPGVCVACGGLLKPNAAFCAACGHRTAPLVDAQKRTGSLYLGIWLYLALLGVQLVTMVIARITQDVFAADLIGTIGFAIVTLAFFIPRRSRLLVQAPSTFRWYWYVAVAAAAVPIALGVHAYVKGVSSLFGIHSGGELDYLFDRSWAWALLLIVILPPLVEELAFRGVIFGALRESLTVSETLLVSSFAFAIIHLSVPTLLTHMPLGLYFGWLRYRSGSLWPGVLAHACHNAVIIAIVTM